MFTKSFWSNAVVRAFKTFAQTAIAVLGAGSLNVFDVDFLGVLGVSLGAALLSILTSVSTADTIDQVVPGARATSVPGDASTPPPRIPPQIPETNGPPTDASLVPPGGGPS